MQSKKAILIIFIIAALLMAGCSGMLGNQAETSSQVLAQQPNGELRTVQVSGMGEAQVEPDTAVISLGVETEEETAQAALQENNVRMQTLIETLEKTGIPSENVQTQTIRLIPRYEFNETDNGRILIGYAASNIVEVNTDDFQALGALLDQAVNAGANTIEGIRFEVSDHGNVIDQVRETAVENARHKAEELASLTGTTLGPVLEIQESSSTPGPVIRQVEAPVEAAAVSVSPGTQSITVQVQVTWILISNNE